MERNSLHYTLACKVKGKVHPVTGYEGPQALDGVDGQRHTPAALPSGERPGRS